MILLRDDQLPELVESLAHDFPASFNIYYMARNKMRKHLDWPGVTFVVDRFPDFAACVCRTDPDDPDVPVFTNGYSAFIHARDPKKLKELLDQPGIFDWSQNIGFHSVQRPAYFEVLQQKCLSLGGKMECSPTSDYFVASAFFTGFSIKDLHCEYSLPAGYRVGPLEEKHAEQVTREKHYGDLRKNLSFFKYLLRNGFATAAVFNEHHDPVAYVLQRPEGGMGCGYVVPEYRGRGFFKVVLYELLQEMGRRGETHGYADVTGDNKASLGAMLSIGGSLYEHFEACWAEFIPKTLANGQLKNGH
ncbi:hypothetical protein BV898_04538 [Hypsibius exemplaris]|uniref:Glycine N-acyltransferase-like protein n=1 Tax=Hypsibius exemplaris TaxID=2072580 RepID=A0A1W0X2F8_HYPEX|nr:hypothetical protein BV898_04538 [Hypsibius exemplaris]